MSASVLEDLLLISVDLVMPVSVFGFCMKGFLRKDADDYKHDNNNHNHVCTHLFHNNNY